MARNKDEVTITEKERKGREYYAGEEALRKVTQILRARLSEPGQIKITIS
ncbi:MAG TPA: hypothetical protein VMO47_09140 [Rhodothermales bacterium]|nr:hypothetical protein [Rhodothermales bacterium]